VGENSRNRVKIRKIWPAERFLVVARKTKAFITSTLEILQGARTNGTRDAFLHSAQQLGNGAIVEWLCGGRSFLGVRAGGEGSNGYAEKGAPTKKVSKSLAAASSNAACNGLRTPDDRAHELTGRCPRFFLPDIPTQYPELSQAIIFTHFHVIRRTVLWELAHSLRLLSRTRPNLLILNH
jgi:hypothetical protein